MFYVFGCKLVDRDSCEQVVEASWTTMSVDMIYEIMTITSDKE